MHNHIIRANKGNTKLNFTDKEIRTLIRYCDVKRDNDERNMRRIRRNLTSMQERYDSIPKQLISEDGIPSPKEELECLSQSKAEAVVLKQKLKIELSLTK